MPAYTIDRRRLLAGMGGLAVMAGAAGSLTGCNNAAKNKNTAAKNESVALPTYKEYEGLKPDLPGTEAGVMPAFRTFPSDLPQSVPDKPGNGEKITGMGIIYTAVPPGPPQNAWWAELNDKMGVTLDMQMVPNSDYGTKFATTIAGNDLPDMLMLQAPNSAIPNLPQLLAARFTDLSEHLSGDAILDYPNLANVPTEAWRVSVYNGGIYGIPIPRGAIGSYNFIRKDLFDKYGVDVELKSYDDLVKGTKALTSAKDRRWAFGTVGQPFGMLQRMNGCPNGWRSDGGKLTNNLETEEYKQSVTDMIAMWKSGVMHPDAFSTTQPFKQLFNGGQVAINAQDGYAGWNQYILDNQANSDFELGLMPQYARTGGELAHWWFGSGFFSINSFKKTDDPERIKLLLRVCNYLAAPFGTEEYLFRLYGKEGREHTVDKNGSPVYTKPGVTNTAVPIRYLADAPPVVFQPGRPKDADLQHAYQELEIPTAIADPTRGLYSNTNATKNATISTAFNDGVNEIIQGRKPMSDLNDQIKRWKSGGGDDIRSEFEEELQKASSAPS